ncbi:MAG: RNA polymerase sporulation sigma factor SigK [Clostridia bacterium]|nr:RNA polymerase sporulation sigma factor SigK [Clostridia bacterium]
MMQKGVIALLASFLRSAAEFVCLILGLSTPQHFPPPLPADTERTYFLRARQGDERAREKLIEHNLRLVAHIVRKYYGSNPNSEDLVSIGSIGLIKAIDSFRVENGAKFATYAAKCIQNEILMYFRARKKLGCEVSINETIDTDRDGNPLTYIDIIATEDTIADDLDRRIRTERALKLVNTALDPRERQIIVMRYGLGEASPKTQREVAALLGISRSYVSRIEKAALEKLRSGL